MTLAELLISAEIDPHDFQKGAKYLAQDKLEDFRTFLYSENPLYWGNHYTPQTATTYLDLFEDNSYIALEQLASDWKTPLSVESYTAAWNAAHNVNVKEEENVMREDVKSEWPKIMQAVYEGDESYLIVEFTSEQEGTVIDSNVGLSKGHFSKHWVSCADYGEWKPYTIPTQSPSAALPSIPDLLTAQDIVKQLEGLNVTIKDKCDNINQMNIEYSKLWLEYEELRATLLTLI